MKQLWVGRRFQLNERGNYAASGKSGTQDVRVEIDAAFLEPMTGDAESILLKLHPEIQRAAREKWAAGLAIPVPHGFSGRLAYHRVTLSSEDLVSAH